MGFPDKVGWRWEEWHLRVIKHHVCTYFLPTGTSSACQSPVLMSALPSPWDGLLLNNSAYGRSFGRARKEECPDHNTFSNNFIYQLAISKCLHFSKKQNEKTKKKEAVATQSFFLSFFFFKLDSEFRVCLGIESSHTVNFLEYKNTAKKVQSLYGTRSVTE